MFNRTTKFKFSPQLFYEVICFVSAHVTLFLFMPLFFCLPVSLVLFMEANSINALKTLQPKLNSILLVSAEASGLDRQRKSNNRKKRESSRVS